jgi:hypothetical protein
VALLKDDKVVVLARPGNESGEVRCPELSPHVIEVVFRLGHSSPRPCKACFSFFWGLCNKGEVALLLAFGVLDRCMRKCKEMQR